MARPASQADQGEGHRQRPRRRAAALIAYFDTSAFIKLVVDEPGTREATALWEAADRRVSSRLLYPEARAALAGARRAGRLDAAGLGGARLQLERLWAGVDCVELTCELGERAGDLAEGLGLRGYDAVHLASAEIAADVEVVLASGDGRLVTAAQGLGITVAHLP